MWHFLKLNSTISNIDSLQKIYTKLNSFFVKTKPTKKLNSTDLKFFFSVYGFIGKFIFFIFILLAYSTFITVDNTFVNGLPVINVHNSLLIYLYFAVLVIVIFFIFCVLRKLLFALLRNNYYSNMVNVFLFFIFFLLNIPFINYLSFVIFYYLQFVLSSAVDFRFIFTFGVFNFLVQVRQHVGLSKNIYYKKLYNFFVFMRNTFIFLSFYTFWFYYLQNSVVLAIAPLTVVILFVYAKYMYLLNMSLLRAVSKLSVEKHAMMLYKYIANILLLLSGVLCFICLFLSMITINNFIFILFIFTFCFLIMYTFIFSLKPNHYLVFLRDLLFCIITSAFVFYFTTVFDVIPLPGRMYIQSHFYNGYFFLVLWA